MRYKSPECCNWKLLSFVLFSLIHIQRWMIHSSLGTMEQYNNLRGGIISKTEEIPPHLWQDQQVMYTVLGPGRRWLLSPESLMLVVTCQNRNPEWTLFFLPCGFFSCLFHRLGHSEDQPCFPTATVHFNPWLVLLPSCLPVEYYLFRSGQELSSPSLGCLPGLDI